MLNEEKEKQTLRRMIFLQMIKDFFLFLEVQKSRLFP